MIINRETWLHCKTDYITGKGSLAAVARQHGLRRGSVERRAGVEGWTQLRHEFEAAQMAKLIPPPVVVPPLPVASDGTVSSAWLTDRQGRYYRENAALVDKARGLLNAKLDKDLNLSADSLTRLLAALGSLVSAEALLLGLRHQQRGKRSNQRRVVSPDPE
jgi:hypothetical protein